MLKFINLKKLTAKTLVGILMIGSLVTGTSNKKAVAGSCGNNGYGNNLPVTVPLSNGNLTISVYDPGNPSNFKSNGKGEGDYMILDLEGGKFGAGNMHSNTNYLISFDGTSYNLASEGLDAETLVKYLPDIEKNNDGTFDDCGSYANSNDTDYDDDGISNTLEIGSNANSPIDTDSDGVPDYADTDSDNDGVLDSNEAVPALWGIDEDDGQLFKMGDYTDSSTMTDYGQLKWNNNGTIETIGSDMEAMTLDENGDMYIALDRKIIGSGNGATLLKFNIADASTTADNVVQVVGIIGINFDDSHDNVSGLSINPNTGNLVALLKNDGDDKTDKLYVINKGNASVVSEIGDISGLGEASTNAEDIEHAPDGTLYVTDNADDHTYKVNGLTGAIIEIVDNDQKDGLGSSSVKFEALGWDFANNRLIGFDDRDESLARLTLENGNNQEYYDTSSLGLTDVEGVDFVPTEDGQPTAFLDYDNDGVPDIIGGTLDDEDGNGIPDSVEIGNDPSNPVDSDNDGIPNYQDTDDDNNGIADVDEIGSDPDNPTESSLDDDDIPDYMDLDDDGDGINDSIEGTLDSELDDDELPNHQDHDSDGDGIPDADEGTGDPDEDGNKNFLDVDSNGNGFDDENDNIANYNDDGQSDIEVENLPDGGTIDDVDGDGIKNFLDLDIDGDNILNENEEIADSNDPGQASDVRENNLSDGGTIDDVDGDGIKNFLDVDSDGDGLPDKDDPYPYTPTFAD